MKKAIFIFITILLGSMQLQAQTEKVFKIPHVEYAQIDLGVLATPMLDTYFLGYNFDLKVTPLKNYYTGVNYTRSSKSMSHDFGFGLTAPVVDYYEVGWINQYQIVSKSRFLVNVGITNGLALIRLGDDAFRQITHDPYNGTSNVAKEVVLDKHYMISPEIDILLPLYQKEGSNVLLLQSKLKYRCLLGEGTLGDSYNLNNFYMSIGLAYKMFHK